MAQSSAAVEQSAYMRLLVLGAPKCGKTTTIISTAEKPVYVINSDDAYSLRPAARVCEFDWDLALGNETTGIEKCIREAREGVKAGKYKTIVWDTITKYSARIEDVFADATRNASGEADGRRYWVNHRKHLHNIIDRLFMLKAHVIVTAHYIEAGGAVIDGQVAKAGDGVVPSLGGQSRTSIPAEFQDVVFLDKKGGKRSFVTAASGVYGPGCRNLPGVESCEADVGALWGLMTGKKVAK